ncbi:hypothetical protein ACQSED_26950 [Salmonella enterica]|uniref:hypothetical protein n=1 Tax=Salmonella enterica TaxID=28901 RepID=UPI003D31F705
MRQKKQRAGDDQRLIRLSTPVIFPFSEPFRSSMEAICDVFSQENFRQEARQILASRSVAVSTYDSRTSTEEFRTEIMAIIEGAIKS